MGDNSYFPLFFKNEEDDDYKMLESINSESLEDVEKILDDCVSQIWKELINQKPIKTYNGGSWAVKVFYYPILAEYIVEVLVYDIISVPIWNGYNEDEALAAGLFAAAAMKNHSAKKLTNVFNGDIINIEIKNYDEGGINEEL